MSEPVNADEPATKPDEPATKSDEPVTNDASTNDDTTTNEVNTDEPATEADEPKKPDEPATSDDVKTTANETTTDDAKTDDNKASDVNAGNDDGKASDEPVKQDETQAKAEQKTEEKKEPIEEAKADEQESKDNGMMKAVVVTEQSGKFDESIKVQSFPKPTVLKANEVIVKVYYGSINPIDYKMAMKLLPIWKKDTPYVFGFDFCGEIVKIGPNVTADLYKIGDKVCGQTFGTSSGSFAEYCVCSTKALCKITNIPYPEAAALPLVGCTSHQALFEYGKLTKDDKLLILGGSTSTGMIGIQLAKDLGCSNITVTSSQVELCKSVGATEVVNYREAKWDEVLKGKDFDICYDCVGEEGTYDKCRGVLKKKDARIITIVGETGGIKDPIGFGGMIKMGYKMVRIKSKRMFSSEPPKYTFVSQDALKGTLNALVQLYEEGKLKVTLDKKISDTETGFYSFDNIHAMINKCKSHRAKGKLVIKISQDIPDNNDNKDNIPANDDIKDDDNKESTDNNADNNADIKGNGTTNEPDNNTDNNPDNNPDNNAD